MSPQGGILSPFLWNLVVDDLLNFCEREIPGYLQAFADDLVTSRRKLYRGHLATYAKNNKYNRQMVRYQRTQHKRNKTEIVKFTWSRNGTIRPLTVGGNIISLSNTRHLRHMMSEQNTAHSLLHMKGIGQRRSRRACKI